MRMSYTFARVVGGICIVIAAFMVTSYFLGMFSNPGTETGQAPATAISTPSSQPAAPAASTTTAANQDTSPGTGSCNIPNRIELKRPFGTWGGFSYAATLPNYANVADSNATPTRSKLIFCEDGKPLGPPHSQAVDIEKKGDGRYLHWEASVVFSASDNSNANTNNRFYSVIPNN